MQKEKPEMPMNDWEEALIREADAHLRTRNRELKLVETLKEIVDVTIDSTYRGAATYWRLLAEARGKIAKNVLKKNGPLPPPSLKLSDYSDIRSVARAFAHSVGFHEEAEDFGSYSVARAWERQAPISYQYAWYNYVQDNYSRGGKNRQNPEHFLKGDHAWAGEEAISDIDDGEEEILAPTTARTDEPNCEHWDRMASELELDGIDRVVFICFFSLGYTANEIAFVTGYSTSGINTSLRDQSKSLSAYFELKNEKRSYRY